MGLRIHGVAFGCGGLTGSGISLFRFDGIGTSVRRGRGLGVLGRNGRGRLRIAFRAVLNITFTGSRLTGPLIGIAGVRRSGPLLRSLVIDLVVLDGVAVGDAGPSNRLVKHVGLGRIGRGRVVIRSDTLDNPLRNMLRYPRRAGLLMLGSLGLPRHADDGMRILQRSPGTDRGALVTQRLPVLPGLVIRHDAYPRSQ